MKNILKILFVFILILGTFNTSFAKTYLPRAKSYYVKKKFPPKLVLEAVKRKYKIDLSKVYSDYRASRNNSAVVRTKGHPCLRIYLKDLKNSSSNHTKTYLPRAKSYYVKKKFPPKLVLEAVKRKYKIDLSKVYSDYRASRNNSAVVRTKGHPCLRIYLKDLVKNKNPKANAGADKTITEGETVTLNGSGTDSDGTIVKYEWYLGNILKHTGQNYTISGLAAGTYTYTLKVTDNSGAIGTDNVIVNVKEAPNTPPTISSITLDGPYFEQIGDYEYTVGQDDPYTITISGKDSDGDNLTYYIDGSPISGNSKTFSPLGYLGITKKHKIKVYDGKNFSQEITITVIAN